jgi:iron(III) transport system substrate-binding protein
MATMKKALAAAGFAALAALAALPVASRAAENVPAGYPASYAAMISAARAEGRLFIYGNTDQTAAAPLVNDFQVLYPFLKVEYADMNSTELYNRLISETAAGSGSADAFWSSAMDLQVKLVADGYTQPYASPEVSRLPAWAVWKNEAFGTTFEPAVFVYNKRLLPAGDIPATHADFLRLLTTKTDALRGKITTYDPERAGIGYMLIIEDARQRPDFWDFAKALGAASVRVYTSTGAMMERISSGEHLLGYNMVGSYALVRAKKDASIGIVMPRDYTLVLSRVLCIAKSAKNPNAAKLWVDYLLSRRGQNIIANQSRLFSIRDDVTGEATAAALRRTLGAALRPIPVSPALLENLDQKKRLEFLRQWQRAAVKR